MKMYSDAIKYCFAKKQAEHAREVGENAKPEDVYYWENASKVLEEIAQDYERKAAEK